jgi:hypothetical protein
MQPVWQGSAALAFGLALMGCIYDVPDLLEGAPVDCAHADLATSRDHCGACDHSCLGGACTDGHCEPSVVANGQEAPSGLALDATQVYWTTQTGGTISKAEKLDVENTVVLADMQPGAFQIVQDEAYLYWTNSGGDAVMKIAKDGGDPILFASENGPGSIAADDEAVYWVMIGDETFDGFVRRKPKAGGPVQDLATDPGYLTGVAIEGDYLYWGNKSVGTLGTNQIKRIFKTGGSVEVIADAPGSPRGLAFYDGALYWVEEYGGAIRKWEAGVTTTIATAQYDLRDVAVDAGGIFATSTFGLEVVRLAHGASEFETLATGQPSPHDVAIDATAVYWTNYGGPTVMRLAR